jgi:hypothetical protein
MVIALTKNRRPPHDRLTAAVAVDEGDRDPVVGRTSVKANPSTSSPTSRVRGSRQASSTRTPAGVVPSFGAMWLRNGG